MGTYVTSIYSPTLTCAWVNVRGFPASLGPTTAWGLCRYLLPCTRIFRRIRSPECFANDTHDDLCFHCTGTYLLVVSLCIARKGAYLCLTADRSSNSTMLRGRKLGGAHQSKTRRGRNIRNHEKWQKVLVSLGPEWHAVPGLWRSCLNSNRFLMHILGFAVYGITK